MSSARYRRLLTNLPSMAAVVNSFQSQEVQVEVFKSLIEALEDSVDDPRESSTQRLSSNKQAKRNGSAESGLADVVEGDSIHSIAAEAE